MITIIVPAYNEEALIVQCLQSIMAEFGNVTYQLLVVDNGSTDKTAELAKLCGAEVIYESNKGITRARQTGLERAQFELCAFIDADNDLPAGWLDFALAAIVKEGVVAASGPIVYSELRVIKRIASFGFYLIAKVAHQIFPMLQGGNFILKKSAILEAGGFNTAIDFYGEDTDTAVRLSKIGKVVFDLDMWAYSSSRRFEYEGLFNTGARYIMNYLWVSIFGRVYNQQHIDVRPK